MKKKTASYRDATDAELQQMQVDARTEFFNLKIQQSKGQLEKPSRIRELRRNIARMNTVVSERKLAKG